MSARSKIGKTYWFDLPAVDPIDARSFYEGLFGWTFLLMREPTINDYWIIQSGDELIGGLRKSDVPCGLAVAPVLYFTVDDLPRYSQRVKDLGGKLEGSSVDLGNDGGTFQWFRDRENNLLALWASKETV